MRMRIEQNMRGLHVLVLMGAFIVLFGGRASAQEQFELPRQSLQGPPPIYLPSTPAPTPAGHLPRSDIRTLPEISPQLATSPPSSPSSLPAYESEPQPAPPTEVDRGQTALPAVFRGCWEGRVEYLDSLRRLPGGAKPGFWTAKTYRLCYRRIGNGPFVLTFSEAGIEQNDRITNPEGRMTLLSSDGRHYASMRSDLDFDEYGTRTSFVGSNTFAVHEVTELDCRIKPDGMHVEGNVTGWRDGVPWFRAGWHTVFIREEEPPQQVEVPQGGIPE
jgi:hypothetical protein